MHQNRECKALGKTSPLVAESLGGADKTKVSFRRLTEHPHHCEHLIVKVIEDVYFIESCLGPLCWKCFLMTTKLFANKLC